jgi:hypothetical protein
LEDAVGYVICFRFEQRKPQFQFVVRIDNLRQFRKLKILQTHFVREQLMTRDFKGLKLRTVFLAVKQAGIHYPEYTPAKNQVKRLSEFAITECKVTLEVNDTVSFADAGENFESVTCPRCNADVMEWWSDAMSEAYIPDDGFVNLAVRMPCCGADSTLNDLNYNLPQGFYRVRILTEPGINAQTDVAGICAELETITGAPWRAVYQHI